jgi:cytochrome c-type biogenesis protein CcmE
MRSFGSRKARIIIAVTVVIVAAGILLWLGLGRGSVYYYSVAELKNVAAADNVRVSGELTGGTLQKQNGTHVTFTMHDRADSSDSLNVVYDGALPDTFKNQDGAEVVVEGSRLANGDFQAQTFIAKCPSKYEAAQ